MFCADVQPAIDKASKELRDVSSQLSRLEQGEKSHRDEIDEQKRHLRGEADMFILWILRYF